MIGVSCCFTEFNASTSTSTSATTSMLVAFERYASRERRERASRYRRVHDQIRCILGELLLKDTLAETFGLDRASLRLTNAPGGRPYLVDHNDIWVSLSHSGSWVVCAVGTSPVGVDVERCGPLHRDIAARYFDRAELQYIDAAETEAEGVYRFYRIWTAKESYLKARGVGLPGGLTSFTTCDERGFLPITDRSGRGTGFTTSAVEVDDRHVCTVCTVCRREGAPQRQTCYLTETQLLDRCEAAARKQAVGGRRGRR